MPVWLHVLGYIWLLCGLAFLAIVLFDVGTTEADYSDYELSWLDEQDHPRG